MPLNRRQFLTASTVLGLAISTATAVEFSTWWNTPAEVPYIHLNLVEATVIHAIGGAAFPSGQTLALSGAEANLDRFFDTVLASMTEQNRLLLKLLLETIDHYTLITHGEYFSNLELNDRQVCIEQWLLDDNHLFRGAIQSIIVLLGMGYTAHPTASRHLSTYFRCGFGA